MVWIFRKITDRIKTLLIADAALGLEANFLASHADRKAELLHKAQEYEEQGLEDLAEELRSQVLNLSVEKPLSSVLPVISHLNGETAATDLAKLESPADARNDLSTNNGLKTKKAKKAVKPKAR